MHHDVTKVIGTLKSAARFEAIERDEEWIRLKSSLADQQLYGALEKAWGQVPPSLRNSFALLFCRSEPDSGVWLHHLSTPTLRSEYWAGCSEIPNWDC